MKIILSFFVIVLLFNNCIGQISNPNFENWEMVNGREEPLGWKMYSDTIIPVIDRGSHFEKIENNVLEGGYSLRMYKNINGHDPDFLAETTLMPDNIYQELSALIRMDTSWSGFGKALIRVLEKNNNTYQEIGFWEFGPTTNGAETIYIPLNHTLLDSIKIQISLRVQHPLNVTNAYSDFIVDKLELSTTTPISDLDSQENEIQVYPNPSSNFVFIKANDYKIPFKISLFNQQGILILEERKSNVINIKNLPSGIYTLQIIDSNKNSSIHLINKI